LSAYDYMTYIDVRYVDITWWNPLLCNLCRIIT